MIVAFIMVALGIPPGSRASVKNVMRNVLVFEKDYDPNHNVRKRGKNSLICDHDGSANISTNPWELVLVLLKLQTLLTSME